jgi:chromatin segregation and condensation protein Rec8/ScpA/Scc1 (kleisin family)
MIVALLAVLELTRLQAIILVQQELFSKIWLRKHKMFDVVFAGGESISDAPAEPLRGIDEQYL